MKSTVAIGMVFRNVVAASTGELAPIEIHDAVFVLRFHEPHIERMLPRVEPAVVDLIVQVR